MDGKIIEERNVYLYELSAERFKEIKGVLRRYDNDKAVIVREDNGKVVNVSFDDSKVYKNYVWMEKRCKAAAAKVFKYKLEKDINKEHDILSLLEERKDILDKYFNILNK